MNIKILKWLLVAIAFILSPLLNTANAGLVFYVYEQDNNVVIEGGGRVNTADMQVLFTSSDRGFFNGVNSIGVGNFNNTNYYQVTMNPNTSFGIGTWPGHGDLHTDLFFGVDVSGLFYLPVGYVSNSLLEGTTTYLSRTLANLGLVTGDYSFVATTNNSSITNTVDVIVGRMPVPIPSTLLLALLGLYAMGLRRSKQ